MNNEEDVSKLAHPLHLSRRAFREKQVTVKIL